MRKKTLVEVRSIREQKETLTALLIQKEPGEAVFPFESKEKHKEFSYHSLIEEDEYAALVRFDLDDDIFVGDWLNVSIKWKTKNRRLYYYAENFEQHEIDEWKNELGTSIGQNE